MNCIYLQASSLTSTTGITIGGHRYISGNYTAQGNLNQFYFQYDSSLNGFAVDIRYAQAAAC
jgi:hypothetical protein